MGLRDFFDRINNGSINEASDLLTKLGILPNSRAEVTTKVSKYQELDPVLKDSIPAVLRGAMECIYSLHSKIKIESRGITPTVQARLTELQDAARHLHTFANLANVPGDVNDIMLRLEAHMI